MKGILLTIKWVFISILILLAVGSSAIVLHNVTIPEVTPNPEQLSKEEKARLNEATHLRSEIGNEVWPGWGNSDIPTLLYNEKYAFLTGMDNPDEGWFRVPYSGREGGIWEYVPDKGYYRQELPATGETPQAFTVKIGDEYAASMTTKEWTGIKLMNMIKADVPWFVAPFIPYGLVINQFNSDWHISAILHESFHAYQAKVNYNRFKQAELAAQWEKNYLWDDQSFRTMWKKERGLLATAMQEENGAKRNELVSQWWKVRTQRRQKLSDELIEYEKEREWLEGMAKYAEVQIWKKAGASTEYRSVSEMSKVSDFDTYNGSEKQWEKELNQLKNGNKFSESMFYYSGWAQAELLDRLHANWKARIFDEGVYLEDLLWEADTISLES